MTIVSIGYRQFAIRKAADAAAIVRIIAEAVPLECEYRAGKLWYYPAESDRNKISMEVTDDRQILRQKPPVGEDINLEPTTPRRRGLRLVGPSIKTPC